MFSLWLWFIAVGSSAHAADVGLDPQNRLHLGVNVVNGPSPVGVTGGFDTRLTRLVSVDLGGFVSPVPIATETEVTAVEYPEYMRLRHGVYVAPGLRIPHPQPKSWAYDFVLRAGGGVIWSANLDPELSGIESANFWISPAAAGVAGADALVRVGSFGVRASGKAWMYAAYRVSPEAQYFMLRTQWGLEGLYQF